MHPTGREKRGGGGHAMTPCSPNEMRGCLRHFPCRSCPVIGSSLFSLADSFSKGSVCYRPAWSHLLRLDAPCVVACDDSEAEVRATACVRVRGSICLVPEGAAVLAAVPAAGVNSTVPLLALSCTCSMSYTHTYTVLPLQTLDKYLFL